MPFFIITYGPAGSGKGYLKPTYLKLLDPESKINRNDIFTAEIDNYVEQDDKYKDGVYRVVFDLINGCYKQNKIKNGDPTDTPTNTPTDTKALEDFLDDVMRKWEVGGGMCSATKLSEDLTNLYTSVRRDHNNALDGALMTAITERKNIIFETTGKNPDPLGWLWGSDEKKGPLYGTDYDVIIIFPYVHNKTILERAKNRFKNRVLSIEKCFNNSPEPNNFVQCAREMNKRPPRLPNIPALHASIADSQRNLLSYLNTSNDNIKKIIVVKNNANSGQEHINLKNSSVKDIEAFFSDMAGNIDDTNVFINGMRDFLDRKKKEADNMDMCWPL